MAPTNTDYPNQTFAGFIAAGSKVATDPHIATLQGKIIGIIGTIELHQRKPEIKVMSTYQITPYTLISGAIADSAGRLPSRECRLRLKRPAPPRSAWVPSFKSSSVIRALVRTASACRVFGRTQALLETARQNSRGRSLDQRGICLESARPRLFDLLRVGRFGSLKEARITSIGSKRLINYTSVTMPTSPVV
jgi:hypothetical protein